MSRVRKKSNSLGFSLKIVLQNNINDYLVDNQEFRIVDTTRKTRAYVLNDIKERANFYAIEFGFPKVKCNSVSMEFLPKKDIFHITFSGKNISPKLIKMLKKRFIMQEPRSGDFSVNVEGKYYYVKFK